LNPTVPMSTMARMMATEVLNLLGKMIMSGLL
jgi:hypothetical protein